MSDAPRRENPVKVPPIDPEVKRELPNKVAPEIREKILDVVNRKGG